MTISAGRNAAGDRWYFREYPAESVRYGGLALSTRTAIIPHI